MTDWNDIFLLLKLFIEAYNYIGLELRLETVRFATLLESCPSG